MKQTNFELAVEVIGQAVYELLPIEDPTNANTRQAINSLMNCAEEGYVLIRWPESKIYLDKDWFSKEAILALGSEDKTGIYAYFIPIKRVI